VRCVALFLKLRKREPGTKSPVEENDHDGLNRCLDWTIVAVHFVFVLGIGAMLQPNIAT
jgi:hypothetical protein